MSGYLLSVIATVLLSTVFIHILPQGKTNRTVKWLFRSVCLTVLIAPLLNFFAKSKNGEKTGFFDGDFFSKSVIQTDKDYIQYCKEKAISIDEENLAKTLSDKFGVEVFVRFECENKNLNNSKNQVFVVKKMIFSSKTGVLDEKKQEIIDYVKKEFDCDAVWE